MLRLFQCIVIEQMDLFSLWHVDFIRFLPVFHFLCCSSSSFLLYYYFGMASVNWPSCNCLPMVNNVMHSRTILRSHTEESILTSELFNGVCTLHPLLCRSRIGLEVRVFEYWTIFDKNFILLTHSILAIASLLDRSHTNDNCTYRKCNHWREIRHFFWPFLNKLQRPLCLGSSHTTAYVMSNFAQYYRFKLSIAKSWQHLPGFYRAILLWSPWCSVVVRMKGASPTTIKPFIMGKHNKIGDSASICFTFCSSHEMCSSV